MLHSLLGPQHLTFLTAGPKLITIYHPALGYTMQLARVIGTVVATVKSDALESRKLLVIQPLSGELANAGKPMVAVDSSGAGVGEVVMWCRGRESSFPFAPVEVPTDCTIVGIVDSVHAVI